MQRDESGSNATVEARNADGTATREGWGPNIEIGSARLNT